MAALTLDHVKINALISGLIESPWLLIGAALVTVPAWLLLNRAARATRERISMMRQGR